MVYLKDLKNYTLQLNLNMEMTSYFPVTHFIHKYNLVYRVQIIWRYTNVMS